MCVAKNQPLLPSFAAIFGIRLIYFNNVAAEFDNLQIKETEARRAELEANQVELAEFSSSPETIEALESRLAKILAVQAELRAALS